jgi:hypothetical protein
LLKEISDFLSNPNNKEVKVCSFLRCSSPLRLSEEEKASSFESHHLVTERKNLDCANKYTYIHTGKKRPESGMEAYSGKTLLFLTFCLLYCFRGN